MEVYRGRKFSVKVVEKEIPGRGKARLEVVEYPESVVIIPVLDDGRLVMLKQYRGAVEEWLYELPAGTVEPGEEPEACAARELREETGYEPGRLELLASYYVSPGYSTELQHLYMARDLVQKGQQLDEDEAIEVVTVGLEEALDMLWRGAIRDLKTVAGLLIYHARVFGRRL